MSFTMEKVTEVYFNNEKLPMQTAEMTANEIEWYWYSTRLEAGGTTSYATDRPADGGIGYGVAVEGKDDNGNELTFKLYIPFSSEIKPELTPEDFTGEAEPQELSLIHILLENYDQFSDEVKKDLIGHVRDDAQWLVRLVENMLSITRFNEGAVQIDNCLLYTSSLEGTN